MLPAGDLKDRVDVIARGTDVQGQEVTGLAEFVQATSVPCLILTVSAGAIPGGPFGGMALGVGSWGILGKFPVVRAGNQLRVRGRRTRFTVRSVERFPNATRFDVQACALELDATTEDPS